ncbi:autotransporter domain-containing protein [Xenorhabdus sp. Flor]|uniref:autotransporter domain-containing protein n=1 Tax=Xenorhabdus cabanillasii TaxID=351673 RepID=UPI0019A86D6D|nr:autotransporter domain-containing protein [Xenorhabdus sp. Flor]MBD2816371.1 autotransporter domain-containing protein [Xenorhabdus sp. Flor]
MKKAFLFTPALLALSISAVSNAYAYDKVYVFGDSLSDSGNQGRFTTDGKNKDKYPWLYNEYLTQVLIGKKLIESNDGGSNYAVGGATAIHIIKRTDEKDSTSKKEENTTKEQLRKHSAQHNNQLDSNSIYIHWIGGNDIRAALEAGQEKLLNPADKAIREPGKIIKDSALAAGAQIKYLADNGAGLVIAPTVPDVGTTPKLLEIVLGTGLTTKLTPVLTEKMKKEGKSPDEIKATIEATIKNILHEVHTKINEATIPSDDGRNLALQKVFHDLSQMANAYGLDPESVEKELTEKYKEASTGATKLTNDYNNQLENVINQSNGNILRADVNGLLREVIANPMIYGFGNNLGYACGVGKEANECESEQADFDSSKEFIFSDNFHPSPLAHKILGQYIESIYIAPSQVMTLNQVNRAPVKGTRASLDGHLQQLRSNGNEHGKFGVFGGYSGSRNNTFTLGGDYQLTEGLLLGALYSNDKTERSSVSNFAYNGNAHVVTTYALWNVFSNAWLSGDLHHARINYDSLTRSIQLGEATRRESGSTTGKQWGARFAAGWDIPVADVVTTSPIIQFAWDKGGVKGYRESDNNSTSMHFSDQNYTSKVGTLGWRVDTQLGRFNPYASVQFNHQFGDTHFKLRSAINSTKTSFVMDSGKQSKNWRQYTVGANANLFGNVRGFASVTRNEGSSQDPSYNFNLGINASF